MPAAAALWALELEYDGTGFVGWQRQNNGLSLQALLEDAATRLDGAPVISVVAGRTDAGVHAQAQIAQIALRRRIAPGSLAQALNFHLKPHRFVVRRATLAPPGWNARFSALSRSYRYTLLHRDARPALDEHRVWHIRGPLDVPAMHQAAQSLLGRHDFTSFRASACQAASPWRTLDRLDVSRHGETVIIEAQARSFLHHQVRNMVGTLHLVGNGRWPGARVAQALAARDRAAAGPTAPACGLCLVRIEYPQAIFPGQSAASHPPQPDA